MSTYKTTEAIHAMMDAISPVDKKDRASLVCTLMLKLIEWTPEERIGAVEGKEEEE